MTMTRTMISPSSFYHHHLLLLFFFLCLCYKCSPVHTIRLSKQDERYMKKNGEKKKRKSGMHNDSNRQTTTIMTAFKSFENMLLDIYKAVI